VDRKKTSEADKNGTSAAQSADQADAAVDKEPRKNGGWREVEAMREKAALKESLADVWDEDFDLDDEILADFDHTAEFFTPQKDTEEEDLDEDGDPDEFFEDDQV
jgi:hypothetical protein